MKLNCGVATQRKFASSLVGLFDHHGGSSPAHDDGDTERRRREPNGRELETVCDLSGRRDWRCAGAANQWGHPLPILHSPLPFAVDLNPFRFPSKKLTSSQTSRASPRDSDHLIESTKQIHIYLLLSRQCVMEASNVHLAQSSPPSCRNSTTS